jgi:transcriptional regulator with XRE-family HTH domain
MASRRSSVRSEEDVQVDVHVGVKLRQARILKKLSQTKLGEVVGLTFQQIQKYEKGSNRIGASRLWKLSQILALPVSYFFEGLESGTRLTADDAEVAETNRRKSMELVRNFHSIKNERAREAVYQLIKKMAKSNR